MLIARQAQMGDGRPSQHVPGVALRHPPPEVAARGLSPDAIAPCHINERKTVAAQIRHRAGADHPKRAPVGPDLAGLDHAEEHRELVAVDLHLSARVEHDSFPVVGAPLSLMGTVPGPVPKKRTSSW